MPPNILPKIPATGDTLNAIYVYDLVDSQWPDEIDRTSFEGGSLRLTQALGTDPATSAPSISSDTAVSSPEDGFGPPTNPGFRAYAKFRTYNNVDEWHYYGYRWEALAQIGVFDRVVPEGGIAQFGASIDIRTETCSTNWNVVPTITTCESWARLGSVVTTETITTESAMVGQWTPVVLKGYVWASVHGETKSGTPLAVRGQNPTFFESYSGSALSLSDGIYCGLALASCASYANGSLIPIWFMDPVFKIVDSTES